MVRSRAVAFTNWEFANALEERVCDGEIMANVFTVMDIQASEEHSWPNVAFEYLIFGVEDLSKILCSKGTIYY